jgi:ribonuclease HII
MDVLEAARQQLWREGTMNLERVITMLIAGVDEVGRGPLAGPVMAAAVIIGSPVDGLADSKKISGKKREILAEIIKNCAISWAIGSASVEEIDHLNILEATLLAMQRAITNLAVKPDHVQIDGQHIPRLASYSMEAIINGDALVPAISAASIVAKVARDQLMVAYDKQYPNYGFAKHKGYGTTSHLSAIKQFGASPIHRLSFAPLKRS